MTKTYSPLGVTRYVAERSGYPYDLDATQGWPEIDGLNVIQGYGVYARSGAGGRDIRTGLPDTSEEQELMRAAFLEAEDLGWLVISDTWRIRLTDEGLERIEHADRSRDMDDYHGSWI